MKCESRNIYRNAREVAGYTQERWAEAIGVSVESVRNYEAGKQLPGDDVVKAMSEISGLLILGYWHLGNKSELAADMLPRVECVPLAQAVCGLLSELRRFSAQERGQQLMEMAADGRIDHVERAQYARIMDELDGIVRAAISLKYAESGG